VPVTQPSGLARLALVHLDGASRFGMTRPQLLHTAGLSEDQLRDPDARIPLSAVERIWRATAARSPDPLLGLKLGATVQTRQLGLVGYTLVFSRTLGAALERLARYSRIVSDALVVELGGDTDATWVRLDVQPVLRAFRPAADGRLAAVVTMCRELVGAPMAPQAVQFPYRRPDDVREYEKFFRAPLAFGALSTAFLLTHDDLARPVVWSDDALTGYLEQLASQPLRELGTDPASGKPMVIKDGRFGPYVTDGETNASLRKGDEVATLTVQRAAEMLADRRAAPPSTRRKNTTTRRKAATPARSGPKRS